MRVYGTIIGTWALILPCCGIPKTFGAEHFKNCCASPSEVKNRKSTPFISYPVFIRQSWSAGGNGEYVNLTFETFDKLGNSSVHTLISRVRFQKSETARIRKLLYDKCFFEVSLQQAALLFVGQVLLDLHLQIQWVAYGHED
jgi:hypothetical protein